MNPRRHFILSLAAMPLAALAGQGKTAPAPNRSPKTLEELKMDPFVSKWIEAEFKGRKFAFGVGDDLGEGESYIDLHGWIYNQHFKEWRRIFLVHTRSLYGVEFKVDIAKGIVSAYSTGNTTELKGIEVFRFDLRATSDDSAFTK
jgi:hypothetical protein